MSAGLEKNVDVQFGWETQRVLASGSCVSTQLERINVVTVKGARNIGFVQVL